MWLVLFETIKNCVTVILIACGCYFRKQSRPSWKEERKLNVETFGAGDSRRGYRSRSGYRGNRGYSNYNSYRGRGRNGGDSRGRGGYSSRGAGGQRRNQGWVDYEYFEDRRPPSGDMAMNKQPNRQTESVES